MHVISRRTLVDFWRSHPDSEQPLRSWYADAKAAKWANPAELKDAHRSASFPGNNRVVFNIKGNNYRLVVRINFLSGTIFIRFVGTHSEYDKINAATI